MFSTQICRLRIESKRNELTIHTLPHLKCISLVSVGSSLPCINMGVRIELTYKKSISRDLEGMGNTLERIYKLVSLPVNCTKLVVYSQKRCHSSHGLFKVKRNTCWDHYCPLHESSSDKEQRCLSTQTRKKIGFKTLRSRAISLGGFFFPNMKKELENAIPEEIVP